MVFHPCQPVLFGSNPVNIFHESREASNFARDIAEVNSLRNDNRSFFVMDVDRITMLLDEWFNCLPRVQPFYSVNCNSDPVLLRILAKQKAVGFHCITRENVDCVTEIDTVESDRILYANPCWTKGALRHASQAGVKLLAFDSIQSLDRILGASPDAELILNVCLDPMVEDSNAALVGCTLQEAPELLQLAATLGANCIGIGFNIGSGCSKAALYTTAIEVSANLFEMARSFGLDMRLLNIGGGFANSYFHNQDQFATFSDICHTINEALDYFFPKHVFPSLKIIAKPGRFFAAPCFSLVTNIVGKDCVDASQVTNDEFDSGTSGFIYRINDGYYGSFGCRVVANCEPHCTPLFSSDMDNTEHYYGSICGPTLCPFDVVQPMCRFRQMEQGDWLLWTNMGAYSMQNRGSLDDSDTSDAPVVYYFATLSEWQKINGNVPELPIKDFPLEQLSTTNGAIDDRACSPSLMSVSSGEDDMQSVTSDETIMSDEETDDPWRLLWK